MELMQLLPLLDGHAQRGLVPRPAGDFGAWLSQGPGWQGDATPEMPPPAAQEGEADPDTSFATTEAGLVGTLLPEAAQGVTDWIARRTLFPERMDLASEPRLRVSLESGSIPVDGRTFHVLAPLPQVSAVITTPWRLTASGELDHQFTGVSGPLTGREPAAVLSNGPGPLPVPIREGNVRSESSQTLWSKPVERLGNPLGSTVASPSTPKRSAAPVETSERSSATWSADRSAWPLQLLWQSNAGGESTIWYRDFQLARESEAGVLDTLRRFLRAESPGVRRIVINGRTVWSDATHVNQANQERSHAR